VRARVKQTRRATFIFQLKNCESNDWRTKMSNCFYTQFKTKKSFYLYWHFSLNQYLRKTNWWATPDQSWTWKTRIVCTWKILTQWSNI
jgi:hypothetical protein